MQFFFYIFYLLNNISSFFFFLKKKTKKRILKKILFFIMAGWLAGSGGSGATEFNSIQFRKFALSEVVISKSSTMILILILV